MPETASVERRAIIRAFGGEVILTPGHDPKLAIEKAKEMAKDPNIVMLDQFTNPDNPIAHFQTGKEILNQTNGKIDAFVAGVGTGGTLAGVAHVLKEAIPDVKIVAVEPAACAILSGGKIGPHKIEGIGEGFIPEVLKPYLHLIDEVVAVTDDEAMDMARRLAKEEGLLVGTSSGANVFASLEVARKLGKGKVVVTVLPDSGMRYLSRLYALKPL
jgi:cysteine synthase A